MPPQHLRAASRRVSIEGGRDEYDGLYEDEYSCWPPPIAMAVISVIEIILFIIDAAKGYTEANGPIANALLYNPHRRKEFWRFLTYMFVHVGYDLSNYYNIDSHLRYSLLFCVDTSIYW